MKANFAQGTYSLHLVNNHMNNQLSQTVQSNKRVRSDYVCVSQNYEYYYYYPSQLEEGSHCLVLKMCCDCFCGSL